MPFPTPQQDADAICLDCGHPLGGHAEARCPKCRRIFSFREPSTWGSASARAGLAARMRRPPGLVHTVVVGVLGLSLVWLHSSLLMNLSDLFLIFVLLVSVAAIVGFELLRGVVALWKFRRIRSGSPRSASWTRFGRWGRWAFAPLFVALCLWASWSGAAWKWRWWYAESRLRAEAIRVLASPPTATGPWRSIGTIGVRDVVVRDGRVRFTTTIDGGDCEVTLVFTPSGAPPPAEGEVLGGGWTLEERSLF